MSTMRALIVQAKGQAIVTETKQPDLRDDYVKVRVTAVALNPSNYKSCCLQFILRRD